MAIELDYAFLAEYAKTVNGTLTVLGASFTEVKVPAFPSFIDIAVAGRVRKSVDDSDPQIRIEFADPKGDPIMSVESSLETSEDTVEYAGKVASVFAFRGPLPLSETGLYTCEIFLDDHLVRKLAFSVGV